MVKVIDFAAGGPLAHKMENTGNPMTMIVQAQLRSLEVKGKGNRRKFEVTKELIRLCYGRGYSRNRVRLAMNFIDWVIRLPEAYKKEIKQFIADTDKEANMDYVPIWARDDHNEGVQQGIQQGIKEGEQKAKSEMVTALLKNGVPIEIIAKSTGLPVEEIKKFTPTDH